MSARSAATCCRPPAASTCAARAAPASSTCARDTIGALEPPFIDLHAATLDRRRHLHHPRRRAPIRELGAILRRPDRPEGGRRQATELGIDAIWARLRVLADGLRARLAGLKGVTLTDLGAVKGAIVTFAVAGADHTALRDGLRAQASTSRSRRSSLPPRSQGSRPEGRHARIGACLQHRGGTRPLRRRARR